PQRRILRRPLRAIIGANIGARCAWLSPKVQGKRDARSGKDAGGGGKVTENKALRGFPGGNEGHRRFVRWLRMYGGAYTCRVLSGRPCCKVSAHRETTSLGFAKGEIHENRQASRAFPDAPDGSPPILRCLPVPILRGEGR